MSTQEPEFVSVFLPTIGHGFGTIREPQSRGDRPPPTPASSREALRSGLPEIYRAEDFSMRFVRALEEVLDPIVALLDSLPSHFDIDLAPDDVLELIAGWLGIELAESQSLEERRELLRHAMQLGRLRGTRPGIELALRLGFPGVPFRIEDHGGVTWAGDASADAADPSFVVYCDVPLETDRAHAVATLLEQIKPAHVRYRLRVRTPKKE